MDKGFLKKCKKAHQNILTCIEEGYRKKDVNILIVNFKRLNDLMIHYQRMIEINLGVNDVLSEENKVLEAESASMRDERFLRISESKGRYREAKKMLEDFYEKK